MQYQYVNQLINFKKAYMNEDIQSDLTPEQQSAMEAAQRALQNMQVELQLRSQALNLAVQAREKGDIASTTAQSAAVFLSFLQKGVA